MEPNRQTGDATRPPMPTRPVMDIKAQPKQRVAPAPTPVTAQPAVSVQPPIPTSALPELPVTSDPIAEPVPSKPLWKKPIVIMASALIVVILAIGGVIGANMWYQLQLQPATADKSIRVRVTIEPGSTPDQIGKLLQEKKVIRNGFAFSFYTREQKVQSKLQAGTFNLKPSDTLASIVSHLVGGKTDEFSLTFLPGATVAMNREVLLKAGYPESEVDAALKKTYDHPIFASKPAGSDLEGYIFGETYNFTGDATAEEILTRTFDQFEAAVKQYDLVNAYQKQGLSLYQGITLASIIQREVANDADEKQVAQVFFKRLREGGTLGSDVTFIYAAKKLGVPATPTLDSPYNTRIHPGLPPGPISTPGLSALLAVAHPAAGDFSYFVAGDDGKTYFAHTYEEHQQNIANYCHKNCEL